MQAEVLEGYRLSPQQRHLWMLLRCGRNDAYQATCAVAIKGCFEKRHLRAAARNVVARHEILRTTFQCLPEMTIPMQVIEEAVDILWQEDSMGRLDEGGSLIEKFFHAASHPFDLTRSPLLHCHLIERPKQDYILILRLPAICADSVSLMNLVGELSRSYTAVVCGETADGEVAQYADLAEWQNELIESEETRAGREYWRNQALQRKPLPQLAFEGPPVIDAAFEPWLEETALSPALTAKIESFARARNASPGQILLACWQILLWRYTGQSEVEVGAVFDGRRAEEIKDALGLFAKYLPVTSQLEEGLQFGELLEHLDRNLQTAQDWQEYFSLEAIAGSPAIAPGASYFPFCFEPEPQLASFPAAGVSFTILKQYACIDCFKIKLSFAKRADRLVLGFHFNSELYGAAHIQLLCGHFQALLENAVTNGFAKIGDLEMLTDAERRQFLVENKSPKIEWPQSKFAPELIAEQANRSSEAIAVVYEANQLTFYELNERAGRLANYLRGLGVGPESVVGLCMERSLDLIVSLLAVLKTGGAYLPLDPSYPQPRLSFMLEDAGVRVLLTQAHLRSNLPKTEHLQSVDVSAQWDIISRIPAIEYKPLLSPDNLAYVIYTSGSTGKPKGVMLRHGSLANYLLWASDYYPLNAGCGAPVHSSLSFDLTITSLFTPLLLGGCVHLLSNENEIDALARALKELPGYSLVKLTPAHMQLLAELLRDVDLNGAAHSLVIGGENLPAQAVERWKKRAAQTRFFNEYGPTESVVGCCVYEAGSHPEAENGRSVMPIGRPIANAGLYLFDKQLRLSPKGMVGELWIGGEGLARGYLHHPALTAERFVPSPFPEEAGARLYKTGDLARYLRDGQIECLGRLDDQVKIRGFRVELGEIEACLMDHLAIREAVVVAREDNSGGKSLTAYYTLAEDSGTNAQVSAESLWRYLSSILPEHMIPAAYVLLQVLPLTSNGKLDRRALPAPGASAHVAREYLAPVGEIETALARIWSDLLRVERVGRHDNFFALGGHSLLTVTLIERMRSEGLHADVRAFFASPTLAELAAAVSHESRLVEIPPNFIPPGCEEITPEMLPLARLSEIEIGLIVSKTPGAAANVQDIYPLAPLQEGILFHYLLETEGDPYLGYGLYRFDSRRRLETFLQSLQFVIDRHDILRTAVHWEGLSEPMQVVWREAPLIVEEIHFDSGAGDVSEQLPARFDPRHYRIDISQAPMMRAFIAPDGSDGETPERRWVMMLLFQHLSLDHFTMEILLKEIQAHQMGRTAQLPAPLPFRNFVAQARLGVSQEDHKRFFRNMLGDMDEPTAPYDLIDAQRDGSDIRESWLDVDPVLAGRIQQASRSLGVSAASLCHLACGLVLGRVSGRTDVVFGTVLFGRMQSGEGADRAPGMFINTLPIRIRLDAESVRGGVLRTHSLLTQLMRHEHASLALAQRCSAVAAPTPLFSAYFNYRHTPASDLAAGALGEERQAWEGIEALASEQTTNYPFSMSVDDWGGSYMLGAKSQSPIDTDRVCAYLNAALEQIVTALEQAPALPIYALDVLPASERRQLLTEWNVTDAEYPRNRCVHELFAEQIERVPERIAVVCEEHWLSYGELNRRANKLGNYLRSLGVGPEVVVGLCLDRSVEMVTALLGAFKAGGAYLPLDPEAPVERLGYVLGSAGVGVALTQRTLKERLQAFKGMTICLDEEWEKIDEESERHPESQAEAENLAYVIYTSGSTGWPKGVMIRHRSLVNYSNDICRRLGLEEGEADRGLRFATISTIAADLGNTCIYPSLLSGGLLHILSYEVATDGARYEEYLKREPIDVLKIVPSHLSALIGSQGNEVKALPSRFLILGGEALSRELVELIKGRGEGCEVINHYGPTETTIGSLTAKTPEMGAVWRSATAPIGRPIANTASYILDRELNPAPLGVRGELYISGEGLARGYLKKPDLTAERFTPNPFSREGGTRVYRTGDECRYSSDGKVEFLGRADSQVKIRGYRIELGEIQVALGEHRRVRQSVAVARENGRGEKRLTGYVVGEDDLTTTDLKSHLRTRLPAYMVPEDILILKEMPITANGKVDWKRLPIVESAGNHLTREYVGARTPVEEVLVNIFEEVLNLDRVGVHDDFFEIGGHSLSATRVISQVRGTFDTEIAVKDIFDARTVAKLAESLIAHESKSGQTEKIALILRSLESMTDEEMITELSALDSDRLRSLELMDEIQ